MKIYMCNLCNKIFKQKSHYDKHIQNKKKPCLIIAQNILQNLQNLQKSSENYDFSLQNLQKSSENYDFPLQNLSDFPPFNINPTPTNINSSPIIINPTLNDIKEVELKKINNVNSNNNEKELKCDFCDKFFSRHDNLQRHLKDRCKNKKHIDNVDEIKSKINNNIVSSDKYEKIVQENIKLIEMLEEYKQFIKENNLIKNTIPTINNSISDNSTTNNNNINNGAINNGTVHNTTINNIVQFGKEDLSKLNLVEMMNIYLQSTGGNIFGNMLKYINLNPNFPENFNIFMGDLARENVKIHNGKKFITKKFKNVKGDILNTLSSHITNMCQTYIQNPKLKKNDDVLSKIKINDISVKLINDDDITPFFTVKKEKKNEIILKKNISVTNNNNDNNSDSSDEEYLDLEGEKKLVHYENKRIGLQEITAQKLKDELYNNKDLIENYHKLT